jgi:hypothetical protein
MTACPPLYAPSYHVGFQVTYHFPTTSTPSIVTSFTECLPVFGFREQYQATAPMGAGGNRNALNRELGVDGQRNWSHGLLSCTEDCGLCMSTIWLNFLIIWLSRFPWEVATPPAVPASSTPKINSASNICKITALRFLVEVNDALRIVPFMAS